MTASEGFALVQLAGPAFVGFILTRYRDWKFSPLGLLLTVAVLVGGVVVAIGLLFDLMGESLGYPMMWIRIATGVLTLAWVALLQSAPQMLGKARPR
jgi:hypothetical protein